MRHSIPSPIILLIWISSCLPCVTAADLVPLVASGAVCAFMLFVLVFMCVFGFLWSDIKSNWMKRRGKVKMPKSYFRKREEAKKNLLNGSNGSRAPSYHNPTIPNKTADTASWVQGWKQENSVSKNVYEEQDVTMELEDEIDKEFWIETSVVDNEVLDVGPYKSEKLTATAQKSPGKVYNEPYIYTVGDRTTTITRSSKETGGMVSSVRHSDGYDRIMEMKEHSEGLPGVHLPTSSSEALVKL